MAKKAFFSVLALVLLLSVLFCGCSADSILSALSIDVDTEDPAIETVADVLGKEVAQSGLTSSAFTYLVFSDGTAAVTGYSGTEEVLNIPSVIDGHTVIALENKALYKSAIKELVLPDSLEVIGNFAAMYCEKLEKVTFGKGIRNIGVSAFESEGDNTKSVGKGHLTTLVWNGTPEIIREKAFMYADKLTEINLPEGVRVIEEWAFAKCFSADKIILRDGLETIGDHAFLKCRNVKEIVIPKTCKLVDVSAFYQCRSAESIEIAEGVEVLKKGAFEECEALKQVTVPNSVKTMEPYIFYNCTALESCKMGSPEIMEKDIFTGTKQVVVTAPSGSTAEEYAHAHQVQFTAA